MPTYGAVSSLWDGVEPLGREVRLLCVDTRVWSVGFRLFRGLAMSDEGEGSAAENRAEQQGQMRQKDKKDVEARAEKLGSKDDPHVTLPREAQGRIGQHLRRVYGEILSEPLPDRFSQLLESLAKTERSK